MQCEMCGSSAEELFKTNIEGTTINVCKKCSRYGKVVEMVKVVFIPEKRQEERRKEQLKTVEDETIFVITPNYTTIVKESRERLNLKQEELAKKINERDTIISKIETGTIEPSMKVARKLEKFLGITLVEEHKEGNIGNVKDNSDSITIGDLIKVKRK